MLSVLPYTPRKFPRSWQSAYCSREEGVTASSASVESLFRRGNRSLSNKLFESSRLHALDSSASESRTEHKVYIDVFLKHRWYSGNHKVMVPRWSRRGTRSSITLVRMDVKPVQLDKLTLSRNRFEKRTYTCARYELHLLSAETGLPCLSSGNVCQYSINSLARAPKEAYSMTTPGGGLVCRRRCTID